MRGKFPVLSQLMLVSSVLQVLVVLTVHLHLRQLSFQLLA